MFLRNSLSLLLGLVAISGVGADVQYALVKDLDPTISSDFDENIALHSVVYQDRVFFRAAQETVGIELFSTDGTATGTGLFLDIHPGASGSDVRDFTVHGELLFFTADDGVHGKNIWVTDGTQLGTYQIPVNPGGNARPESLIAYGGYVYFLVGKDLWRTDGTVPGTEVAVDEASVCNAFGESFRIYDDRIYFISCQDSELWRTDGTEAGTERVWDTFAEPFDDLDPEDLTISQGLLFFSGQDAAHGRELWRTDGTEAGTFMTADLWPGPDGSNPGKFHDNGNLLYFSAGHFGVDHEPARSDGTTEGTFHVGTLNSYQGPSSFTRLGERAVFNANVADRFTKQLWVSDGTADSVSLVFPEQAEDLFSAGDYVLHYRVESGLWRTDGDGPGTYRLNRHASFPRSYIGFNGGTLFDATQDGVRKLWFTDGSPEGTAPITYSLPVNGLPGTGVATPTLALFPAKGDAFYSQVWKTDGTTEGTGPWDEFENFVYASGFRRLGETILFYASASYEDADPDQWRTDGTEAGTYTLFNGKNTRWSNYDPDGSLAHFSVGTSIYETDGTTDGTILLGALSVGGLVRMLTVNDRAVVATKTSERPCPICPYVYHYQLHVANETGVTLIADLEPLEWDGERLHRSAGLAYFRTSSGIWVSDGTEGGTVQVRPFDGETLSGFAATDDFALFAVDDDTHGDEPWISDGTPEGTMLLADLVPDAAGSAPAQFVAGANGAFFTAETPAKGRELWFTDGTESGTLLVKDIFEGPDSAAPESLRAVGSRAYFTAFLPETGREVWVSDGTEIGTRLAAETVAGSEASPIRFVDGLAGGLAFAALDLVYGEELWYADGHTLATGPLQDTYPGRIGGAPALVMNQGSKLFLADSDPNHGRELWMLEASISEGEGEGEDPGEGEAEPQGEGEDPGEGEAEPQGDGEDPGEGEAEPQGDGEDPGEGEAEPQGDGENTSEGEIHSEGEGQSEGEGEAPSEGEASVEGATEAEAEIEGEIDGEATIEGEGEADEEGASTDGIHASDQNGDGIINLSELLRVIQFFNSGEYSCANPSGATEDGFQPGAGGDRSCPPHDADYNPQDWLIGLSELLRTIQFFNSGGYFACPQWDPPTEDGYCPGDVVR